MNKKPQVIVIYGMVAVGKLTVAKALAKELGIKITHNHLLSDLVWSLFEPRTIEANTIIESLRYDFYAEAVRQGKSFIMTHCYSHDYVSPTGLSDPEFLKALESKLNKAGADVLFVHLQADGKALLERVKGESRKEHRKLTDESKMKDYLTSKIDLTTSAPVKNNLVIDNTDLSPEEAVKVIIERLKKDALV